MAEKISQLDAASSANYTDLLETSQSDGMGGWLTKKVTDIQLTSLISGRDQIVTTSTALTNPCPNVIYCNFTTVGQQITLPIATGATGHPAGKIILFKIAPTNTQGFDVLLNDGSVLLSSLSDGPDFAIAYSTNSNQNGTPIRKFEFLNNNSIQIEASQVVDAGTMILQDADDVDITGGTMDNVSITDGSITGTFDFVSINSANPIGITGSNISMGCDLNVSNGTGGVSRNFIVDNSSTTAGDNATILIQTTGSGGDPRTRHSIAGGQSYVMGIDNSDSDAFVRSLGTALGTTNYERVSSAGEITHPLQPCFEALLSTSPANVTGNGEVYTIICDTEIKDQNSDYNPGTGTFTASVAAQYPLYAGVTWTSLGGNTLLYSIVTSNRTYDLYQGNPSNLRDGGSNAILKSSCFADMDVADTATLTTSVSGTTTTVDLLGSATVPYTYFGGYLAC